MFDCQIVSANCLSEVPNGRTFDCLISNCKSEVQVAFIDRTLNSCQLSALAFPRKRKRKREKVSVSTRLEWPIINGQSSIIDNSLTGRLFDRQTSNTHQLVILTTCPCSLLRQPFRRAFMFLGVSV